MKWWDGEADVWIDGILRTDWNCSFFSLDSEEMLSQQMEPRHLMAVAQGPLTEALPNFQEAAWGGVIGSGRNTNSVSVSGEESLSRFPHKQVTVADLLEMIESKSSTAIHHDI